MTIAPDVEAFLAAADTTTEKQPGQWRRKGVDGPPYVTDPSGELVKSGVRKGLPKLLLYGRPSSRGKIIENTYNLQKWGERMAMWGAIGDPEIVVDAGNITDEIDTAEWRRAMDRIVVRAKDAARAMIAAHRGSHVHTLTEDDDEDRRWVNRLLAGEELGISQAAQKALVQAWRRMLAVHGFEILAVEAAVVCDRWKLAGTLDRIVRLTRDMRFTTTSGEIVTLPTGTVLILDLKTGKMTLDSGIIQYWQSYAVQLAAYALGVPYDVDTETRSAWPFEVSQDWAIIAHLDVLTAIEQGEARCTLVLCDLRAGIAAGDLCMEAAAWGRNDAVFSPPEANPEMVVAVPVPIKPATDDDSNRANGEPCHTDIPGSADGETTTTDASIEAAELSPANGRAPSTSVDDAGTSPSSSINRRQEILARLTALPDAQKARIKAHWPNAVPSLRSQHEHTDAEFDAIEACIAEHTRTVVERANLTGPGTSDRTIQAPISQSRTSGGAVNGTEGRTEPDEGESIPDSDVEAIRKTVDALDDGDKMWLAAIGVQVAKAGYPVNFAHGQTRRRWSIARALIHLARHADDELTRVLLGVVLGEEVQPAVTLGTAIAALTIDEATRLADLARAVGEPSFSILFNDDGSPIVEGQAVEAARPPAA